MTADERETIRKLLVRYETTLGLAEDLALTLLDVLQPEGVVLVPEQARDRRRSAGDALAIIDAGTAYASNLWKTLDLERRRMPTSGPLPASVPKERRRHRVRRKAAL